jgi:hypothetical protein
MTMRTRTTLILFVVLVGLAVLNEYFGWVPKAPPLPRRESDNGAVCGLSGRRHGFGNRRATFDLRP